jgi:hypothetical protein
LVLPTDLPSPSRNVIFISKATPEDDEFVLWLAPRLEATGYTVFADVLSLEPGDRWRKQVTGTLQNRAIKMLLCCRDSTLAKDGVQEEIGIAFDVAKELNDSRFVIPLRLEKFKKVFGIGELQYVDFLGSWAGGLRDVLDALERQGVTRSSDKIVINPNWESYKARLAIKVENRPEHLTTNWLRITKMPKFIRYYTPRGAVDHASLESACRRAPFPVAVHLHGFFAFAPPGEVNQALKDVGRFVVSSSSKFVDFLDQGSSTPRLRAGDAKNVVMSLFRTAWESFCRQRGLYEYPYSGWSGFHVGEKQASIGKRIPWGERAMKRSAMLRNAAAGKIWQFGVSGAPQLWPFPHFRLKARVLFTELTSKDGGRVPDVDEQHRLRRTICKGWRNKAWHGRLMAFTGLLANQARCLDLPLSRSASVRLDARPIVVTMPVTTAVSNAMSEEAEEQDVSTLGNVNVEDEEVATE